MRWTLKAHSENGFYSSLAVKPESLQSGLSLSGQILIFVSHGNILIEVMSSFGIRAKYL